MKHRKKLAFGAIVIVGMMASASVAFACVKFRGKLTVATTLSTRADGNQVVGDGSSFDHQYCSNYEPTTAAEAGNGEQITVTVAGSTGAGDPCTSSGNKLTADGGTVNNKVYLGQATDAEGKPFNLVSGVWQFNDGTGCFRGTSYRVEQSDITVSSTGSGSATFNLSGATYTNGTTDASHMCVGSPGNGIGIIAPLRVVAL